MRKKLYKGKTKISGLLPDMKNNVTALFPYFCPIPYQYMIFNVRVPDWMIYVPRPGSGKA